MSLPVWEEWIEIEPGELEELSYASLPVWEEWIEIPRPGGSASHRSVSSRMGRVD